MTKKQIKDKVVSMCTQLRPLAETVDMKGFELRAYRGHLKTITENKELHTVETIGKLYLIFQIFGVEYIPYEPTRKKIQQGNRGKYANNK